MTERMPEEPSVHARLRIGSWYLHPTLGQIRNGSRVVHLEPKAVTVLQLLALRPGESISRQELLEGAWPGVVVSDDALTQVVIKLRKAFGDDSRAPAYIETIPKRGYRLVAEVRGLNAADTPASLRRRVWTGYLGVGLLLAVGAFVLFTWATLEPAERKSDAREGDRDRSESRSIAVLPFDAIGEFTRESHLALGVTADLTTDLSKLSGLRVIKPPVADGASIPARYLVSGSVQHSPDRLEVDVNLIETRTRLQVWSERYDRPIADLFDVQQSISREIVEQLAVQVSAAEKARLAKPYTRDLRAYEDFLHGQADLMLRQPGANESARAWYRRAIEKDPNFGRAYAGLALSHAADYRNQWVEDGALALAQAESIAQTAQQIDPGIPEVYWVLGYVDAQHKRLDSALEHLQQAIELDPSYADAYALMGGIHTYEGQPRQTVPLMREAIRLRPDAGYLYYLLLGRAYFFLDDFEQARINLSEALERNPEYLETRIYLGALAMAEQARETAEWESQEIRMLAPEFRADDWLATYPMIDEASRDRLVELLEPLGF